jgi:hypothetical protein
MALLYPFCMFELAMPDWQGHTHWYLHRIVQSVLACVGAIPSGNVELAI